eukprot:s1089_g23.t1
MATGQVTVDANVFQAVLLQVAEATKAAASAAQAAGSPQGSSSNSPQTGKGAVDWSKLLQKPSNFGEGKTVEEDVKSFKDWHWQLQQYLVAIDEGFQQELQQLNLDPTKALSMETATAETRNRSNKLYSLLAGLMKNRCLHILKSAPSGDGYEGLRQLILAMRPPAKWSSWIGDEFSEAVPMEIDRVDGGKSKGKNKGKNQKGKGDKGSGKSNAKGSNKGSWKGGGKDGQQKGSGGKGKNKGKSNNTYSKGKGKGDQKVCFQCGSPGHYAKDCWNAVRVAQARQSGDGNNSGQAAQHGSQGATFNATAATAAHSADSVSSGTHWWW